MHCRLEKAYHAALVVPPPEPCHHCEICFCKFERDLDKPPGNPVRDCRQPDPGSMSRALENGIDEVKESVCPVCVLEQGFMQMHWLSLCCVLQDHPDCSSAAIWDLRPTFLLIAGSFA